MTIALSGVVIWGFLLGQISWVLKSCCAKDFINIISGFILGLGDLKRSWRYTFFTSVTYRKKSLLFLQEVLALASRCLVMTWRSYLLVKSLLAAEVSEGTAECFGCKAPFYCNCSFVFGCLKDCGQSYSCSEKRQKTLCSTVEVFWNTKVLFLLQTLSCNHCCVISAPSKKICFLQGLWTYVGSLSSCV